MAQRLCLILSLLFALPAVAAAAQFADYPAEQIYDRKPAPVEFANGQGGRQFKTRLSKAAAGGPNYAGMLTVVSWECGVNCEILTLVSAKTGRITKLVSTCGAHAYRLYSRLLIVNPKEAGVQYPDHCRTEYYVWNGQSLESLPAP